MGDYAVKFHVRSKLDGFDWALVLYGAAQHEDIPAFLAELVRICGDENLPLIMGGDFNIHYRKNNISRVYKLLGEGQTHLGNVFAECYTQQRGLDVHLVSIAT